MERLTARVGDLGLYPYEEICFINPDDPEGWYSLDDIINHGKYDVKLAIAERIAEYEDTGLTPEEIIELNDFSKSQCAKLLAENARLRERLDKAVEVVRCENCMWYKPEKENWYTCKYHMSRSKECDYCSYGERSVEE